MTISTKAVTGLPAWPQRVRLLRRAAAVVSGLAVLTDLAAAIVAGTTVGAYLALLVGAAGVIIAVRRPTAGLVISLAGVGVAVVVGWDPTALWTVVVFTLFSAAMAAVPPFRSGLLIAGSLYLLIGWSDQHGFQSVGAVAAATTAVAAAGIGAGLRAQARYWGVLEQRAAGSTAQAVAAERLRIARDLHDLIGHEIAVLNMHLGVAEISLPAGADAAKSALGEARAAVQSVLAETQQILELLRRADSSPTLDDPGQPVPGADQLPALVTTSRRLGLQVDADLTALDSWPADQAAGVALYRVVQEALTNASRYGDGTVALQAGCADDVLTVSVSNRLRTSSRAIPGRDGYGLVGMRERLTAIGGDLQLSSDDTTFRLTATFPAHYRSRR